MSGWIQLIASIIGAVGGLVALGVVLFNIGRRVGQLETEVQSLKQGRIDQKEWGELGQKVSILYAIYVEHALRQNVPAPTDRRRDPDKK